MKRASTARAMEEKAAAENAAAIKAAAANAVTERIAAARAAAAGPKKGIVITRTLRVRRDHHTSADVIAGLVEGTEITILGTWSDGKNTWAKLQDGWAAMVYEGETYIQLVP